MSLSAVRNVLQKKDTVIGRTTALKLAKLLLPLFGNDNSHVQLLSIHLFQKVMGSVADEGKEPLKPIVSQSLLPLFLHCHEVNERVAKASRETLHCAAGFLKRSDLEHVLKTEQLINFAGRVLADDRSRAAEHLRWALPYLEHPQEPLREAATKLIGIAGLHLRRRKEELQALSEALQALRDDDSPSRISLFVQLMFEERIADLRSSAGSEEPVALEDLQGPQTMRPPGDRGDGAPGTADD
ncbi:maestro heat-like repeat-containing protein family member 6 [Chamaea fasciata]|uniref:maestro heat-like repeat-containing protein family member 6 n=1 Tax=Chamaea fasciata TaxID=190680 RepID=UPI00336A6B2E